MQLREFRRGWLSPSGSMFHSALFEASNGWAGRIACSPRAGAGSGFPRDRETMGPRRPWGGCRAPIVAVSTARRPCA